MTSVYPNKEERAKIQADVKEYFAEHMQVRSEKVSPEILEQKGFNGNAQQFAIDEFVAQTGADLSEQFGHSNYFGGNYLQQAHSSDNYFPIDFDPKIYDQGVLYGYTPYMTFMETQGRRVPTGYKSIQYIKLTAGFAGEFHTETGTTSGSGEPTTSQATSSVKFMSVPISLSDLIGMGESRTSRMQILNFAMQAFRETLNNALVIGDATSTSSLDGILEIAKDNGYRPNQSSTEMTIKKMDTYDAYMTDTLKGQTRAILTNKSVMNQVKDDLASRNRVLDQYNLTAGINIKAYNSDGIDVPIITDPNVTNTTNNERMLFFDPMNVSIEDFLSMTMITKGKSVPLATDYWLTGVTGQYCSVPTKMIDIYGIV
jgi:hypothetical protein